VAVSVWWVGVRVCVRVCVCGGEHLVPACLRETENTHTNTHTHTHNLVANLVPNALVPNLNPILTPDLVPKELERIPRNVFCCHILPALRLSKPKLGTNFQNYENSVHWYTYHMEITRQSTFQNVCLIKPQVYYWIKRGRDLRVPQVSSSIMLKRQYPSTYNVHYS
jgi:hypothetical protein